MNSSQNKNSSSPRQVIHFRTPFLTTSVIKLKNITLTTPTHTLFCVTAGHKEIKTPIPDRSYSIPGRKKCHKESEQADLAIFPLAHTLFVKSHFYTAVPASLNLSIKSDSFP